MSIRCLTVFGLCWWQAQRAAALAVMARMKGTARVLSAGEPLPTPDSLAHAPADPSDCPDEPTSGAGVVGPALTHQDFVYKNTAANQYSHMAMISELPRASLWRYIVVWQVRCCGAHRPVFAILWRTPACVFDSRAHVDNGMGNGVLVQGSPKVEGTKDQALYYALSRAGKAWSRHILLPLPQTEPRGKAQAAVWYVARHIVVAIATSPGESMQQMWRLRAAHTSSG